MLRFLPLGYLCSDVALFEDSFTVGARSNMGAVKCAQLTLCIKPGTSSLLKPLLYTQRLQNPLFKENTLNYNRNPNKI